MQHIDNLFSIRWFGLQATLEHRTPWNLKARRARKDARRKMVETGLVGSPAISIKNEVLENMSV